MSTSSSTSETESHLRKISSICDKRRNGQLLIIYRPYGSQISIEIRRLFLQTPVEFILLYGCTK